MIGPPQPVRTCIGCRERVVTSDLVRLVAIGDDDRTVVVPDLRRSAPGRGAHLHPTAACLEAATRRRAFARALRQPGPVDTDLVRSLVESRERHEHRQAGPTGPDLSPESEKRSTRS